MSFISFEFVLLFLLCFTLYHFLSVIKTEVSSALRQAEFSSDTQSRIPCHGTGRKPFTYGAAILIEQAREKEEVSLDFTGAAYPVLSSAGLVSGMPTG